MAGDHLDVPLEDAALLEEVELISALMIAASESEEKLGEHEIDRLLGLADHDGPNGAPGAEERPPS